MNKLIIWSIIYLLTLYLFKTNRIKYSSKKILSIISYNKIILYLTILIIVLNTLIYKFSDLPYSNINYILLILAFLYVYTFSPQQIIDDGSYKVPPSYIKKKNKIAYIIVILLLLYNLKNKNKLIYIPIIINFVIYLTLFYLNIKYFPCKYDLPTNWV